MDRILASGRFSDNEIRRINYCRLYLGALTISDLATTEGTQLDQAKLTGQESLFSNRPRWMKVHQELPSAVSWKLWKKANALWSYPDGTLVQPLGPWLLTTTESRISYPAYVYRSTLYVRRMGGEYVKCRKLEDTQRMYRESNLNIEEEIPNMAVPVEIQQAGRMHRWEIINKLSRSIQPRPLPVATFDDYVQQLDAWEVDLLRHTDLFVDPYTACLELHQGFEAGSDGSEKYGTDGSFGWMISTSQGERVATEWDHQGDT
ncbi:hypothetical protein MHU86_19068 [Fragilaria crotonensis]|nr:hypothetical protein MHU86_19068 [Fragilaria crotonensis]